MLMTAVVPPAHQALRKAAILYRKFDTALTLHHSVFCLMHLSTTHPTMPSVRQIAFRGERRRTIRIAHISKDISLHSGLYVYAIAQIPAGRVRETIRCLFCFRERETVRERERERERSLHHSIIRVSGFTTSELHRPFVCTLPVLSAINGSLLHKLLIVVKRMII